MEPPLSIHTARESRAKQQPEADVAEQSTPTPQPQFPMCNLNVTPQGLIIQIALAPGLTLTQAIDAATMTQLAEGWIRSQLEIMKQQQLIEHIKQTKH